MDQTREVSGARRTPSRRVSLLEKVFVWSLVFEPMLFFVAAERTATGVTGNISRLLQIVVLAGLAVRVIAGWWSRTAGRRWLAGARHLFYPHIRYLGAAVIAGVAGWFWGAYLTPETPNTESLSALASLVNSPLVRPAFEYVIAVYYFVYFVVLPGLMLNTPRKVAYFFRVFSGMFLLSLVIGFVDIAVGAAGIEMIPRHLFEDRYVGVRYHGLAGEPREAFVFLVFGLAMYHLQAVYRERRVSRLLIASVIVALALTQSASGLVGLLLAAGLLALYSLRSMSLRQVAIASAFAVFSALFAYFVVTSSARLMSYVTAAAGVWATLEKGGTEFGVFAGQMPSLYPLYDLLLKFRAGDLLPIAIGSGFGSASAVNNRYMGVSELANPASQLVRMLYEVGVVGTILFVHSFVRPLRYLSRWLRKPERRELLMMMLLLLGCFLAHRSATLYIYLGMSICVFRVAEQFEHVRATRSLGVPATVAPGSRASNV